MKCPNCQADNPDKQKFCGECGTKLLQICPKCNAENPPYNKFCGECGHPLTEQAPAVKKTKPKKPSAIQPNSFADERYQVKKFLGEGGKKKVYLVHDTLLDRDVAFALIKTEKLDDSARKRITREARAMGKLGDHPNIVTIHDMGEQEGLPYIVIPFMPGGDVEGVIEKAPEHRLPIEQVISIAKAVCQGLEFAHSKGIIHRDLKPSNVWLSADGTAKIGDFGLAVAVDLSRITQSGMMVGTVSYMPPEQAMGGKVSEKADLYFLGAMVYEMVTGRPPFIGDDSISIIGQHISTPPVSPTWHRADLPPALETLILQLLEKDPSKRPSSAADVLQALESIDTGKISKELSGEISATTENPLYRKVFVGRETELKQLQSAFDSAVSGQGVMMMVVGEPGIGKTAVCEQMSTYVTLRGGKTLVGHCYEEGSLSLPYLAFVEAMRSYVLSREVKDLREELGTGAADIARIVSEIREKLKVKPRVKGDPEEERYRLMQAVTGFLSNAANVQPLLVVLEDLHDSDKGTLDMLTHVSRHLSGARLLIVGTYRDVEVDRNHPLSAALAELRRVSSYGRVLLRGLNADEVRRMLESITQEETPWSLAEAVHRQTEGNPLFVQEVVRFLIEEGLMTQKEGRLRPTKDTPLEMHIPEGLRDVIGKRMSLLSKECNQLLSIAAVIGREFIMDTLRAIANINEEKFVKSLKEAVQLSILEERSQVGSIRYRFTHAFFRQTLYEELIAPQRLQLHQQVARSLERQYSNRLEEHAAELAEHFSQSTDPTDLIKAVDYGKMAAKRATDVYAYGETIRLLEQALKVQKVLDPDDKKGICDLLLALGDALCLGGEPQRAFSVELQEAFSLAEELGDRERASRACNLAMTSLIYYGSGGLASWATPEAAQWVEQADRYAEPDTIARFYANLGVGEMKHIVGMATCQFDTVNEGCQLVIQNLELARRLGNPEVFWHAVASRLLHGSAPQHFEERLGLAEKMADQSRAGVPPVIHGLVAAIVSGVFLEAGQRQHAEKYFNELREIAERTGQANLMMVAVWMDGLTATLDGRLEDAVASGMRLITRSEELGIPLFGMTAGLLTMHAAAIYLGKADEMIRQSETLIRDADVDPANNYIAAAVMAHAGMDLVVAEMLEKFVMIRPSFGSAEDEVAAAWDAVLLEASVIVGHRPAAERILSRLAGSGISTTGILMFICIPRHLGGAAALLGRNEEARKYYEEAMKVTIEMKHRPEIALTKLQLAELLLEHYPDEKKEALEHLDFAIKEFREMKMQPSLERALRHKDILKA